MKIRLLIILLCLLSATMSLAFDKSRFDIQTTGKSPKLAKLNSLGYELRKNYTEATLAEGGYFTLGTNNGRATGTLDDHCGLSFGHPYALTSFPVLAVDGTWGCAEAFFDIYNLPLGKTADELYAVYRMDDLVEFRFSINLAGNGQTITITSKITNLDAVAHTFGQGFVFDPGLGKRGDGWLEIADKPVLFDTLLTGNAVPTDVRFKEKIGVNEGLKMSLNLGDTPPTKFIVANWKDIYENPQISFAPDGWQKLYDLALKLIWTEESVAPGAALTRQLTFELLPPDFHGPAFVRWALPGHISIEDGLLFPDTFLSLLELHNVSNTGYYNCELNYKLPAEMDIQPVSGLNLYGGQSDYQNLEVTIEEIYKDKISEVTLELKQNNEILDSIFRRIFIPSTPVSDTGLVCSIDSILTEKYPEVQIAFHAERMATQARIKNLQPKNVFLYENSRQIENFTLSKNMSSGGGLADIVFVIDCSGSMGDDIEAVRQNVGEFCESLKTNGYDYQLGLIVFSDYVHILSDMTNDVNRIKNELSRVNLYGGRENSLGAIYAAGDLALRPGSRRTVIWITDEDYPVSPEINLSVQDVVNRMLALGITVHSISLPSLQTNWSNPIIDPTGGKFYSLAGNFRDILLEISNLGVESGYLVTYQSPHTGMTPNTVKLEIHYAGLGGIATSEYSIESPAFAARQPEIVCYPNPFNPAMHIQLSLPEETYGMIDVFNILGQRVRSLPIEATGSRQVLQWNARDMYGQEVAAGTYFIQLSLFNSDGKLLHRKMTKVLHLK